MRASRFAGFENTTAYPPYGPYEGKFPATSSQEVELQVAPTTALTGCNTFNQFANYSGQIPCETDTSAPREVPKTSDHS